LCFLFFASNQGFTAVSIINKKNKYISHIY
jgi:hypothetical protein